MHSKTILTLALLGLSSTFAAAVDTLGTAFTYQGKLTDGADVANGYYDLSFKLYDDALSGTQQGSTVALTCQAITNGSLAVTLDFGGVFTGTARWLEIWVRTNNGPSYSLLSPRQELKPTPYAQYAPQAGGLIAGTYPSAVTLNNPANSLSGEGSGLTSLNASALTSGTIPNARLGANVARLDAAQTFTAANSFSGALNLLDPTKSLVFPATAGANSPMLCMFASGTANADRMVIAHSPIFPDWGLQYQDSLDRFNFLSGGNPVLTVDLRNSGVYLGGPLGLGSSTPLYPLDMLSWHAVARLTTTNSGFGSVLDLENSSPSPDYYGAVNFQGGPGQIGYHLNDIMTFRTAGTERMRIDGTGNVGIGTDAPGMPLDVKGRLRLRDGGGKAGLWLNTFFGQTWPDQDIGFIGAMDGTRIGFFGNDPRGGSGWGLTFDTITGNVGIGTGSAYPTAKLQVNGNAQCCALTITGGCDLSEPFRLAQANLTEGSVVVIDETNPGALKLSESAYDTRVAGIVSGANGIKPGISLHQDGLVEGGQNVALSGRVYALADAAYGPIRPGDLLTTSGTPGHCMRATDHARAQGAIIGKAMSALPNGKGMVLVLVSLQ